MVLVKLKSPNEDYYDIWLNRDRIEAVRTADEDFPDCTFVYLSGEGEPFIAKGTVEQVLKAIRNA